MPLQAPPRDDRANSDGLGQGLVNGLLLAIPLWACIGIGFIRLVLERPLNEVEQLVLLVAAIVELILLLPSLSSLWPRMRYRELRLATAAPAMLKRVSLLSATVAAYLHYYYWDIQLQIASLNSVTMFISAPAAG